MWSSSSSVQFIFLPLHTVHGVLKARVTKWFAIPFFGGPHFVSTLHQNLSTLGALQGMAHSFIELHETDSCDQFGEFSVIVVFILSAF